MRQWLSLIILVWMQTNKCNNINGHFLAFKTLLLFICAFLQRVLLLRLHFLFSYSNCLQVTTRPTEKSSSAVFKNWSSHPCQLDLLALEWPLSSLLNTWQDGEEEEDFDQK
jgi:uncharacterized protein YjiK